MNGTLRELAARIRAFKAATGLNYGAVWISDDRWRLLPQEVREKTNAGRSIAIDGVPIRRIEVLPPL